MRRWHRCGVLVEDGKKREPGDCQALVVVVVVVASVCWRPQGSDCILH